MCILRNTNIQVHLQKLEYNEKGQYFLSLISESETHILYRFITQSEIFQAFISWHFDDYGLQIMKTQNSVPQKIRILHKSIKIGDFKQKCQASEKYVHFYALNTWLGLLLHELLHQIAKSAVFPVIVVSKNKRSPQFILYGCHLLKLKCKYSNILRYWFLAFISCKL